LPKKLNLDIKILNFIIIWYNFYAKYSSQLLLVT
jgi:hypothetical protein